MYLYFLIQFSYKLLLIAENKTFFKTIQTMENKQDLIFHLFAALNADFYFHFFTKQKTQAWIISTPSL